MTNPDTPPMDNEAMKLVERLRELLAKATPGPYRAHDHNDMARFGDDPADWIGYGWVGRITKDSTSDGRWDAKWLDADRREDGCKEFRERASADVHLVAEALNALPTLFDLIELLSSQAKTQAREGEKLTELLAKAMFVSDERMGGNVNMQIDSESVGYWFRRTREDKGEDADCFTYCEDLRQQASHILGALRDAGFALTSDAPALAESVAIPAGAHDDALDHQAKAAGVGEVERAVARIGRQIDAEGGGGMTAPVNGERWVVMSFSQYERELNGRFERGKAAALAQRTDHGGPREDQIRFVRDGDMWCAFMPGFINLQESIAGFGETQDLAEADLRANESATRRRMPHRRRERRGMTNPNNPSNSRTAEALLPCPFCGGGGLTHRVPCGWRVSCVQCDCQPRSGLPSRNEAEANTAWNTRPRDNTALIEAGREMAVALHGFVLAGCPVCNGDCASANPPVASCPMLAAQRTVRA